MYWMLRASLLLLLCAPSLAFNTYPRMLSRFGQSLARRAPTRMATTASFDGPRRQQIEQQLLEALQPTHLELVNESHGRKEDESHVRRGWDLERGIAILSMTFSFSFSSFLLAVLCAHRVRGVRRQEADRPPSDGERGPRERRWDTPVPCAADQRQDARSVRREQRRPGRAQVLRGRRTRNGSLGQSARAEQERSRFHSPRGGMGNEFFFARGELCFAR